MPKLYALYGKMGSGKDYLASLLIKHLPEKTQCVSFADALKDEVENLIVAKRDFGLEISELSRKYNLSEESLHTIFNSILPKDLTGVSAYKKTPQMRHLFQFYGDVRRGENPMYFIDETFNRIETLLQNSVSVIITDVRFPNEYEACHEHGAVLIHLNIDRETRHARLMARDGFRPSAEAEGHISEIGLDNIEKYNDDIIITADMSDDDILSHILKGDV